MGLCDLGRIGSNRRNLHVHLVLRQCHPQARGGGRHLCVCRLSLRMPRLRPGQEKRSAGGVGRPPQPSRASAPRPPLVPSVRMPCMPPPRAFACCTSRSKAFTLPGGGGDAVAGIGKKCGKMRKKCGKCGKKCARKCGFVRMVFAPRTPYVSSRLAQLGAQSMDGLMEQRSAVVQLKNITD